MLVVKGSRCSHRGCNLWATRSKVNLCFPILVIPDYVMVVEQIVLNCLPFTVEVLTKLGPRFQIEFLAIPLGNLSIIEKSVLYVIAI